CCHSVSAAFRRAGDGAFRPLHAVPFPCVPEILPRDSSAEKHHLTGERRHGRDVTSARSLSDHALRPPAPIPLPRAAEDPRLVLSAEEDHLARQLGHRVEVAWRWSGHLAFGPAFSIPLPCIAERPFTVIAAEENDFAIQRRGGERPSRARTHDVVSRPRCTV